ncbi:MAG: putative hemolysin [Candidatus Micrarchaeia archaeon]
MKKAFLFAVVLLSGLLAFGCTQQQPSAPAMPSPSLAGGVSQAQTSNPASVNCIQLGGKLSIRKDASGGEYGVCVFANGSECEEWALYRGEGCKPLPTASATAPVSSVNPSNAVDSVMAIDVGENPDYGTESQLAISSEEP